MSKHFTESEIKEFKEIEKELDKVGLHHKSPSFLLFKLLKVHEVQTRPVISGVRDEFVPPLDLDDAPVDLAAKMTEQAKKIANYVYPHFSCSTDQTLSEHVIKLLHELTELRHFKDCHVGLWATDKPDVINPAVKEKYFFQVRLRNEELPEKPKKYKGVVCRGAFLLGTACRTCEKCKDEAKKLARIGIE